MKLFINLTLFLLIFLIFLILFNFIIKLYDINYFSYHSFFFKSIFNKGMVFQP